MKNLLKQKKMVFILSAVILIVVVLMTQKFFFSKEKSKTDQPKKQDILQDEVMPTVDSSVEVNLEQNTGSKEVLLTIKSIPQGTETVEYELSYQTKAQGLQGVLGTINSNDFLKQSYEKKITLGTCSSGKCVYHEVVGKIKLLLRFNGSYGAKVFEKEYEL